MLKNKIPTIFKIYIMIDVILDIFGRVALTKNLMLNKITK